uniref:Uncharacterized protein n=1 Tax=Anguilla anguilla TaxID=7936 RepID=A0A0E9USB4_ANGAN
MLATKKQALLKIYTQIQTNPVRYQNRNRKVKTKKRHYDFLNV